MIAAYDNYNNTMLNPENDPIEFNPSKTILPKSFKLNSDNIYYVCTISKCELIYGYLVYEKGNFEELLYEMMITILSHLVSSAYQNTKREETEKFLTQQNKLLSEISTTDELTGLLNRRGFMRFGQETIYTSLCKEGSGILFYGDMNGLKIINDTYGHDAGDIAIKAEAHILKSVFRSSDLIARIGGDEFCILAPGLKEKLINRIKTDIETECSKWNEDSKYPFKISISMGYTIFNKESSNLNILMQNADEALYVEKVKYHKSKKS